MTKTLSALACGALMLAAAALPRPAAAGCTGCVVGGVLGGLAAGAIIGGALANPQPAYPNDYYHPGYYGPTYGAPPHYVGGDGCFYQQGRYWDQYAGVWRPGPRQLVCP